MSWNRQVWGTDHPTRRRKLAIVLAFVVIGLLWHAILVDFIPARWLYAWPLLAVFALLGVAVGAAAVYGNYRMGRFQGRRAVGLVLGAMLLAPLVGGLLWLIPAKSFGALVTAAVGESHSQSMEGVVMHAWRRHRCDYFIENPARPAPIPKTHCVSEDYFRRYGGQRVRVRLVGDRSIMGTRLTGFVHEAVLAPEAAASR
jgi:hypothetical protein